MSVHLKKRERIVKGGRNRKRRPKTFSTEDAAKAYAKSAGLEKYELVNMKSGDSSSKKIRIIER